MAKIGKRSARLAFHLDVAIPFGERNLVWKYLRSVDVKLRDMDFNASLIIMDMQEYNVILGIDWLAQYSAVIDCAKKRVSAECSGTMHGARNQTARGKESNLSNKGLLSPNKGGREERR